MALNNYSNLKAAIIRLDGSDNISDIVDDAIDMAESQMYDRLRIKEMLATESTTLSTANRFLALPTDFLEARSVSLVLSDKNQDVIASSPESIKVITSAGKPKFYTVTTRFEFDRVPDSAYNIDIIHYAKLSALDDTNTTNDILTNHPSIYLFGALYAINLFNAEEDKAQLYKNKFDEEIRDANRRSKRSMRGPAAYTKFEGSTP